MLLVYSRANEDARRSFMNLVCSTLRMSFLAGFHIVLVSRLLKEAPLLGRIYFCFTCLPHTTSRSRQQQNATASARGSKCKSNRLWQRCNNSVKQLELKTLTQCFLDWHSSFALWERTSGFFQCLQPQTTAVKLSKLTLSSASGTTNTLHTNNDGVIESLSVEDVQNDAQTLFKIPKLIYHGL